MSNTTESNISFLAGMAVVMVVALVGFVAQSQAWKTKAIKSGHAHYIITDPISGKTEFQWLEPCAESGKPGDTNNDNE